MKYGNFVGVGWLPFEQDEIEKLLAHFKKQLTEAFGEDTFSDFTVEYNEDDMVKDCIFTATFKTPFNGCNRYRCTVRNCSAISFFVTKNSGGYLEIKDPNHPYESQYWKKDFKHCPPFSYGCTMSMYGSERPYRKRNWESIQHWSPYTYGTEIKDLTYTKEDFEGVKKTITPLK